ncbi:ATP-binding protein [Microbulbifer sp.]|uniref:ATP-binding protein n=1 Tax=Microbulbifer sp. TaxID=1908541 RepID=UPI003F3840DD
MKSIRIYLVVALLSTITLVNFVSALHGYRASMAEAQQLFDRQLADTASLLSAMPVSADRPKVVERTGHLAFQVWSPGGRLLMRSANAPPQPINALEEGYENVNFSGQRWRVYSHFSSERNYWTQVAEPVGLHFHLADKVVLESVIPILLGLPVAGLLIWFVVGHGLKSLHLLADALRQKRADDLSPLPLENAPEELLPVVQSTNALLARLQASFERERRFSADAAHELRTPISAIKVHTHNLERELSQYRLPQSPLSLAKLQGSIERMAHLVEQILNLYRTTPDHYPAKFEPLDLHELAREVIAEQYVDFAGRGQAIELTGGAAPLEADRFALTILLKNLLNNANKYTPENGRVEVHTRVDGDRVVLRVDDTGPGIAEEEYGRVFERFYRVGGDRHPVPVGGSGLGLSIVQHIARLHHAEIQLDKSKFGRGLSIQVRLPASPGYLFPNGDSSD